MQGISKPDAELLVAVEIEEERGIEEEAIERDIQETEMTVSIMSFSPDIDISFECSIT